MTVDAVRAWTDILCRRHPETDRARLAVSLSSCLLEHHHLGLDLNQDAEVRRVHRRWAKIYLDQFTKQTVHCD